MCVFDISLIQVLHCCYSFSRNWKIKKSCWARFSNYLKYYNQGPGILTVLLSASCTSNTKVIRELALSVSLTLLRLRPKLHQKKEICSILKWFSQTFWLLSFFFFPFFNLFFFCAIKNHFPSSGEIFPIPCPLYSQFPWPSFYLSFHTVHNLGCFQTNLNFYFVLILFVAWKTKCINLKQTLSCLWG